MPVSRKTDIERPLPYFGIFKPVLHIDDIEKYEAQDLGPKGRNDLLRELMKERKTCVMLLKEGDVLEMFKKARAEAKSGMGDKRAVHTRTYFPDESQQYTKVKQGFFFFGTELEAVQDLLEDVKYITERWTDGGFAFIARQFFPSGPQEPWPQEQI